MPLLTQEITYGTSCRVLCELYGEDKVVEIASIVLLVGLSQGISVKYYVP